jgi:flagellar export protein FliJ
MNDDYDLEVLLELREQKKEGAEQAYADAVAELGRRKEYLARRREALREAVARREAEEDAFAERRDAGEATSGELVRFRGFIRGLKEDETELEAEIARAEEAVDDQRARVEQLRDELSEAIRELEAVEQHRAEWEAEQEQVAKRRESSRMDDVAARIWRENNS